MKRAFTLVEIMIALVIFVFGIVSIMYLFPVSLKSIYRARIVTQAIFLAQAKLEEELSKPASSYPSTTEPSSGTFEPDFPEFVYVMRKSSFNGDISLNKIDIYIFHPINNRKKPIAHLCALKGSLGIAVGPPAPPP